MNTPKILASLKSEPAVYTSRFESALVDLETAKDDKKIWNTDFENAKYYLHHACEHALDAAAEPWRELYRAGQQPAYRDNDPRFNIGYMVSPLHAAGFVKKLQKFAKEPAVAAYLEVLEEVALIGNLEKEIKPFIVKGRKPVVKDAQKLYDETFNTGVCAICANRQKLDDLKMVMHGYQMSGENHSGWRVGKCFGVGYKPYELSNEANVAFAPVLESHRQDILSALDAWQSGKITTLNVQRTKRENGQRVDYQVTYTLAENPYEFNQEKGYRIARLESELRMVDSDIKTNNAKIQQWTLQPLAYGSK